MGVVLWTLMLLSTIGSVDVYARPSNNVPLDDWAYGAIEKLDGFGLLQSEIHGTKPYTRLEVARLVHEALVTKERKALQLPPLIEFFLERFQREYAEELTVYGRGNAAGPAKFVFRPVEEVKARYVYSKGNPRDFVNFGAGNGQYPKSGSGIIASEGTPLVYNNDGIVYGKGSNFQFQFSSSFTLWEMFSGYVEPVLVVRENSTDGRSLSALSGGTVAGRLGDLNQVRVDILKGYAKFAPWNFEIEIGRDSLWWGQGYHGDLLMSNNAAPLDMVKVSNPTGVLLPWFFAYLGPLKYNLYVARMEEDFIPAHPMLAGMRVNFKPTWWLEIGYGTSFLFNGEGVPGISVTDFIGSITGIGFSSTNSVDQISVLDFRVQLPFLWNAECYFEYGGEDSGGTEYPEEWFGLGDVGILAGIYFPRITPDGRTDLRLEFARNAHRVDSSPGFWYGHGTYRSGFTHYGMIMGHHMGPDAMDLFTRVTHHLRNDLVVGLDYDYMERGITLSEVEEHVHEVGADVTYDITPRWSVMGRFAYGSVSNFNLIQGVDRDEQLFLTALKYRFR